MSKKRILLLGGNGYIGNRFVYEYQDVYDIVSVDTQWFNPYTPSEDVQDYKNLRTVMIQSFDTIILLAGHSSVKMCDGDLKSSFNNNVRNFVNLLHKLSPDQKFIYASSSSVYGDTGKWVASEEFEGFQPHNAYDMTKYIIDMYAQQSNLQYYGLRFGTVNGFSPIMRNDIMINAMTSNALEHGVIKLFAKDIHRPILDIHDLVRAINVIIENDSDQRGIYNLASFNSTADMIAKDVGVVLNVPVEMVDINSKLKIYNFAISSQKFMDTFDFKFTGNIRTITKGIEENYLDIEVTNRNKFIDYE